MGGHLHDPLLKDADAADIEEIRSCDKFFKEVVRENKKLWYLAGPAIFTAIAQYSLGAVTQVFAGHLTTLELDAVSTENMVIAGLAFGIMTDDMKIIRARSLTDFRMMIDGHWDGQGRGGEGKGFDFRTCVKLPRAASADRKKGSILGMGSALETLCGQAYGAKQPHMLGVYMQRSWVILNVTCVILLPIYIWATPILTFFGQDEEIARLAGKFSLYMIPQLFAYGFNFPIQKFLQAQSKVMTMAWVSALALLLHVLLSWLLIVEFKWGLIGAAVSLNLSWWAVVLGQLVYILMGYCPGAWSGFSWGAFKDLAAFARLSVASAIMMCLEFWYYMLLVVLAGRLENPKIAVAAISICHKMLINEKMLVLRNSVRISNELGAGRPRAAKFSIVVVVMSSALLGIFFLALVLGLKDVYALPFTNSHEVAHAVSKLAVIFAFTLLLNSVAVGAGWQWLVAYINVGCYYIVGLPLGFLLGAKLKLGVMGIWGGMISGVGLQTLILTGITFGTNWEKEAMQAESRIRKWGGSVDPPVNEVNGRKTIFPPQVDNQVMANYWKMEIHMLHAPHHPEAPLPNHLSPFPPLPLCKMQPHLSFFLLTLFVALLLFCFLSGFALVANISIGFNQTMHHFVVPSSLVDSGSEKAAKLRLGGDELLPVCPKPRRIGSSTMPDFLQPLARDQRSVIPFTIPFFITSFERNNTTEHGFS
ncbi:hypothetical protein ACLOJK_025786 [Asimina triloba]